MGQDISMQTGDDKGERERGLTEERDGFRCFGQFFGNGEHEDGEGEEDGDSQSNLLPGVRWQAEDQQGQQ